MNKIERIKQKIKEAEKVKQDHLDNGRTKSAEMIDLSINAYKTHLK